MSDRGSSPDALRERLDPVLDLLATDPASLSSVRDPQRAWDVHVADSLSALELVGSPRRLADVGAGAGFPGLVLAAALPGCEVDLIESVARKAAFIARAAEAGEIVNARAIQDRSEAWASHPAPAGGREAYDVVTTRAVARLSTVAELASPLLREGGLLVAWKGRRDPEEEAELGRAAPELAMEPESIVAVEPFAASKHRHLHAIRKTGPTPDGLPRRPGVAKRKPRGRFT